MAYYPLQFSFMITDFFLKILYVVVKFTLTPLALFDDFEMDPELIESVTTFNSYLTSIGDFFPLGTLLIILSALLIIELAIGTYKGIMWLIKRIPLIG